ncbi:MAG: sortase [Patescibacteria group bacterium]|nr:sortase [Patescibacteria group bacterium]
MDAKQVQNFVSIYDLEAEAFAPEVQVPRVPLWKLLLKATGIFLTITFIVFLVANYHFVRSQILDWRNGWGKGDEVSDADDDGMPNWWEVENGLDDKNPKDSLLDGDGDGATNSIEFQFGTDPKNKDTDNDGYLDGEEIENGYNPNGIGRIDSDKDGIHDWWEKQYGMDKDDPTDARKDFDGDYLNNKKEYKYHTNPRKFDTDHDGVGDGDEVEAGGNPIGKGPLRTNEKLNELDKDGDLLLLAHENLLSTDPDKQDTDGDGFDDYHEVVRGYDPTGEGTIDARIRIPSVEIEAPIIWAQSENEEDVLRKLDEGVVHYPGSAFPSMNGNSYITGHSSYYSWNKSEYKDVFAKLNKVSFGDEIVIHMSLKNGKKIAIVYSVVSSEVVVADDERLFRDYEGSELTVVTCWPLGTDWKRFMVKAELKDPKFR